MVKVTLCYTVTTGRSGHWERHHIKIVSILLREQILGDDCNTRIGIRHNMGQPGRTVHIMSDTASKGAVVVAL